MIFSDQSKHCRAYRHLKKALAFLPYLGNFDVFVDMLVNWEDQINDKQNVS